MKKTIIITSVFSLAVFLTACSAQPAVNTNNQPAENQNVNQPVVNQNQNVNTAPANIDPNLKEYAISDIKAVFTVYKQKNQPMPEIIRQGNKIFVGGLQGQSVEIFKKDPKINLQEAIAKQFLKGYAPEKCFVIIGKDDIRTAPTNIIMAQISYPKTDDPNLPWFENSKNCPVDYAQTNGIRYFWQDITHPDVYMFFNIGQYSIPGDAANAPWQETFKFIN